MKLPAHVTEELASRAACRCMAAQLTVTSGDLRARRLDGSSCATTFLADAALAGDQDLGVAARRVIISSWSDCTAALLPTSLVVSITRKVWRRLTLH